MKLIIAEKPSLGKAIAEWLGVLERQGASHIICKNNYIVTWLFGHILELLEPHEYNPDWKFWSTPLPIRPTKFKNQLKDDSGIKSQFKAITGLIKSCSEIINAGDPDREGQLLVDEVLEYVGNNKPVQRLWLAAIDDKSIEKAFQNIKPNSQYIGYKLAAEARQQADWLIGMNFTRAFTVRFQNQGYQNTFSVGRVQTPTLKLIVDRDNEIKNFKPKDFYELAAVFNAQTPAVKARLVVPEQIKNLMDEDNRLLDRIPLDDVANQICNQPAKVANYTKQAKTRKQPLLFNLSGLQALANKKFGYSAQQVLDTVQILYENKLTSYPRTDCQYLPESQFLEASDVLANLLKLPEYARYNPDSKIKSNVWNDSKVTAHHAIIPTGANLVNLDSIFSGLGKNQDPARKLFDLICIQYLAQFYPAMKYDEVEILFDVASKTLLGTRYQFKATGKTVTDKGWTLLLETEEDEDNNEEDKQLLPVLSPNQDTTCTETIILSKKTQKPKPYTEGSLIQTMANIHNKIPEIVKQFSLDPASTASLIDHYRKILKETAGLGTEATRAGIIEALKGKHLIRAQGKNLNATELGHLLINSMSGVKPLTFLASPITTAEYEQKLDEIANKGQQDSLNNFWQDFDGQLSTVATFDSLDLEIPINKDAIICPLCIKESKQVALKLLNGTYGAYFKCIGCGTNFNEKGGQPIIRENKPAPTSTGENCPDCGSSIVEREGKYGKFKSCSNYPKCKWTPPKVISDSPPNSATSTHGTCPDCGQPLVERTGKFGKFISCSGYPKCKWTPPKEPKQSGNESTMKTCPICESGLLVVRNSAKGKFLGCNAFPKCKHIEPLPN